MFKSIFTKYILTFMIIIGVSFVTLATIISAMVTNYSITAKQEGMNKSVQIAAYQLKLYYMRQVRAVPVNFDQFIRLYRDELSPMLTDYAQLTENAVMFVTDPNGNIILTSQTGEGYLVGPVPSSMMDRLEAGQNLPYYTTLDGVFNERHVVYALPFKSSEGDFLGSIFVCSVTTTISSFVNNMIRVIILSCLWILLASMITVYYVSDRIIVRPLRDMSNAAKQFSAGRFDVRIKVSGQDEVSQLGETFNNMAAALAKNEEVRRMFLSNVSHDLRTPMTTIAGFIDGILDGTIPPDRQGHYLDVISKEIRRLARLVNTLLDISRMQAGERKFNMVTFDICEMARLILISLEQRITDKHVEVEFAPEEDKMQVHADTDAIYQVMYNLCENAVKFVRENGLLRIRIKYKDKKVMVSVYNTGEGISAQDLPYVFDRFFKADSSRGLDKSGVGLGLFISRAIIESHKEQIMVNSAQGEYCEFVFTLSAVMRSNQLKLESENK